MRLALLEVNQKLTQSAAAAAVWQVNAAAADVCELLDMISSWCCIWSPVAQVQGIEMLCLLITVALSLLCASSILMVVVQGGEGLAASCEPSVGQ